MTTAKKQFYTVFFNKAGKRIMTNPPQGRMSAAIKVGEDQLAYSRKIGDTEYHSYRVVRIGK